MVNTCLDMGLDSFLALCLEEMIFLSEGEGHDDPEDRHRIGNRNGLGLRSQLSEPGDRKLLSSHMQPLRDHPHRGDRGVGLGLRVGPPSTEIRFQIEDLT